MLRFIDLIVKAIEHKVKQVGNDSFRAFRLQKLHQVVVGGGRELDQDLAHYADPGLTFFRDGNAVEIRDDLTAHFGKGEIPWRFFAG